MWHENVHSFAGVFAAKSQPALHQDDLHLAQVIFLRRAGDFRLARRLQGAFQRDWLAGFK
jgi:hypothetical protein